MIHLPTYSPVPYELYLCGWYTAYVAKTTLKLQNYIQSHVDSMTDPVKFV